jgi:ubiquinone/menaquinone biosynthesis C-methylase UbiE
MHDALKLESEKLARSWMQHESAKLRDYLVAGVEDPRMNLQSILSRHFLVRALFGEKYRQLMEHECRFAVVMNWLTGIAANTEAEELGSLEHALRRGADNAEGLEIPRFILSTYASLPTALGSFLVPNYIHGYLNGIGNAKSAFDAESFNTFQSLWCESLATGNALQDQSPTVIEPACGSANDYRFLHSFGIARFLDYTGFDLCPRNIENAHTLFPDLRFKFGNVFEIDAQDKTFDFCFIHDLFEHLSIEGLKTAVQELCRVTRRAICANFFQMDEIAEHIVRPTGEYHWNLLSMEQMKRLFAIHGFSSQIIHIKSFLRQELGCDYTHNPNAFTIILHRT